MDADKLNFLDSDQIPDAEPEQDTEQAEPEREPEPEQAEGKGEPEPEREPEAEPPAAERDERQTDRIPLSALLDEREKRQKAERRAEELERWRQQQESQRQQPKTPDILDDPEAYQRHVDNVVEGRLMRQRVEQSRFYAERDFGKDVVADAIAYFDEHPEQSHRFMTEPSPFHAAVDFVKKQRLLREIGDDPEAWKARQLESLQQQAAKPAPKAPPPSMANQPGAGQPPIKSGSAFDSMFGD